MYPYTSPKITVTDLPPSQSVFPGRPTNDNALLKKPPCCKRSIHASMRIM